MLHSAPQNLSSEFCYFLKIINKQQNTHAKLIVQVVMQSIDDAGSISWSSLISVTLFPELDTSSISGLLTTTDPSENPVGFMEGGCRKESSKAGSSSFCIHMSRLPDFFS